jgi:pteridine reductase
MSSSFSPAVLITGAARRLGRATALHFAEAGFDIALHYHRSEQEAQETADAIREKGRICILLQENLENLHASKSLLKAAHSALPNLSVLVNNASIFSRISFADTTPESLWRDYTLNFAQAFFLTQAFSQSVAAGAVVNMLDTSINTRRGTHFGYLLAKKNLADFTLMAAKELAPAIRVNAVSPGFILPTEGQEYRDPASYIAKLPLQKQPTPQEIATAVFYLANTPTLTGQILTLDGGESL